MTDGRGTRPVWRVWGAAAGLVLAAVLAYHNTFSAPFIFDDIPAITDNPAIRDWRAWRALTEAPSQRGTSIEGRPMVSLSLALNHAVSGDEVWSYHALNLLIHTGAALVLFGVVRRTLLRPGLGGKPDGDATAMAFAVALLWAMHPLLTESVTCVIQRTESLMGFFFLLTLYGFIRGVERGAVRWRVACVAAAWLGGATKEVMAMAPLIVLLYDRTFVAGTFREAWRQRRWLHLALASTWGLTAALIWRSETRSGTVGFGHGVTWWECALTQCRAVALYLKLSLWPHPLVLDYGTEVVRNPLAVLPQAVLLAVLLAMTAWALWRRPALGFLGAWCFVILAPSSSVVPIVTQTVAEHRMYLPLAAIVLLAVVAVRAAAARWWFGGCLVLAAALGVATARRNADYRSVETIWRDNLAKRPGSIRAYHPLAHLAEQAGRFSEAVALSESAVQWRPADATAHFNLAFTLAKAGRLEEAVAHYREAGRLEPAAPNPHISLGAVLVRLGRLDEAIAEYEAVVQLLPDSAEHHFNLAQVYLHAGRAAEALPHYETAARLKPDVADMHFRLGNALVISGRTEAAAAAYREALRCAPEMFEAQVNLAGALVSLGRAAEAVPLYERALQLRPDATAVQAQLARARALAPRP